MPRQTEHSRRTNAEPRWLKLGIAAALGVVAGTMLFATEAQGRRGERRLDKAPDPRP